MAKCGNSTICILLRLQYNDLKLCVRHNINGLAQHWPQAGEWFFTLTHFPWIMVALFSILWLKWGIFENRSKMIV